MKENLSNPLIDSTGIAQMALFDFPVGSRSLLKEYSIAESGDYDDPTIHTLRGMIVCAEKLRNVRNESVVCTDRSILSVLANTLSEVVASAVGSTKKSGLLLSSGYDSRCILSALIANNIKPLCITWDIVNPNTETKQVRRMTDRLGLRLEIAHQKSLTIDVLRQEAPGYVLRSGGISDLAQLTRFCLTKGVLCNYDLEVLLWGQGELFRPPALPSLGFSQSTLQLLWPEKYAGVSSTPHYFSPDLPYSDAVSEVRCLTGITSCAMPAKRLSYWALGEAYPKVYGSSCAAFSEQTMVKVPFLDSAFVGSLIDSGWSVASAKNWKPSLSHLVKVRWIYSNIIGILCPELLPICTDRGYPLKWDTDSLRVFPILGAGVVKHLRRNVGIKVSSLQQEFIRDELLSRLPHSLLNNKLLKQDLLSTIPWPPIVEKEAAKAMSVILYYEYVKAQ